MKCSWLIGFILLSVNVYPQDFHFRHEPALMEGDVRQINILFQSTDQMVWLGTDKGVYSYDGRRYRHTPRPDQQLQKVTALAENRKGQLWAGYEDGYLHTYSLQGLNKPIPTDSLTGAIISKILFNQTDQVFIATYGKGVWLLDGENLVRQRYEKLAWIDDVYDALFDQQGRLWLATDNGIWIYTPGKVESLIHVDFHQGLPDEIVTQLEMNSNGDIWIGMYDHGLAVYRMDRDSVLNLMPLKPFFGNVIGMTKGHSGEVWIGTEKAISRFSQDSRSLEIKLPLQVQERVESLLYDKNGNLWVASGNKVFIANTSFEYSMPAVSGIQSIAVTADDIWLGCESGLYAMSRKDSKVRALPVKDKMNILSMYSDPSGFLWIGTFGQGLYCLDPKSERLRHLTEKDGLSNNSILNMDGRGQTIWLATLGGITELTWTGNPLSSGIQITGFLEKFNFPAGYVYDVYAGTDGKTWFGTDGKGLFFHEGNEFHSVTTPADTSAGQDQGIRTIYSITASPDNTIWISGSKGQILHLDGSGKLLSQIKGSQGLINTLVTSGEGELLMIREGAIQMLNRQGEMNVYNESSGLNSFTPNINAVAKDKDGSIWIADTDRVLHYTPFKEDTNQYVQMYLSAISPASLFMDDLAKLRHDSNFLDVRFTGLWYRDPSNVRYRYMLKGHDQDWIYTQEGRAVYSRLSPGSYTFIVEGSHHEDFSNARSLRKEFVVMPPFYLTWWFVLGSALLVSWGTFSYILARIKRIKKLHQLEKEKTMLRLHAIQAQVNPHFLFNSFNTLSGIIEEDQLAAVDYVDQLSGFFRGVLMHRNAELIKIEEEIEMVRNYTYILQKRYGTNLRIHEEICQQNGWIAPLSIQLLVENAIKHNIVSTEKPLVISLVVDKEWVTVTNPVQPKINASGESTGFGLSSLVARYQYLTKEKIEIRQEQNTFTVKIPIIYTDKPV